MRLMSAPAFSSSMSCAVMKGMMHSMTTSPMMRTGVSSDSFLYSLTLCPRVWKISPSVRSLPPPVRWWLSTTCSRAMAAFSSSVNLCATYIPLSSTLAGISSSSLFQ